MNISGKVRANEKKRYTWMMIINDSSKDGVQYKKPTKMSAPEYIDKLLTWVASSIMHTTWNTIMHATWNTFFKINYVRQVNR